ncbi:hypothetical protein FRB98_003011 [Tulasnella sp. 332]|nr:hypothetical protein FRB98_003011 [Tulasnella sp. 332]
MNPTMDGKLLEIGILERDEDGFEDFNQYMNDDVFKSPPPAITPKRKPKPKTPAKPSSLRTGSNNDIDRLYSNSRNDPTTPRGYFASASPGPPPSTSRRVGSHSRPLAAPAPQVDYDSIPAPSTRKKPISTASSSQNHNRGAANAIARAGPSYNNRTPKTKTPASRRKSVAAAREVSEDSNLSVEGQSQPINDDVDDDSGPEAFNPPDDDVMQVDQEPEPILPRKLDAKNRGKSRLEPEPEERVPVRKADTKGRRKPSVPEPIPEEDEEGMVEDASEAGGGAIAQTAAMMSPKTPADANYSFQKVFMDGEFIAGGILNMPVGGKKPNKGARDNTYIFFVVEGAVRVMVNKTDFIITTNGMFMVPRGNMYYLENIGDRECKLFFAQARKVTQRMIPSPNKATSARPSSALGDRPSRTPQRAGAGAAQASPVAKGKKATSRM